MNIHKQFRGFFSGGGVVCSLVFAFLRNMILRRKEEVEEETQQQLLNVM